MTEVVIQSPSHFPSPQQSSSGDEDSSISSGREEEKGCCRERNVGGGGGEDHHLHHHHHHHHHDHDHQQQQQLSLLTFMVAALRKSLIGCSNYNSSQSEKFCSSMEIGWPSNVRHVAHVTFDRFNGFLGLPVEFEPEVPRRAPSASTNVFGVSTESMQLSFDPRGNSVPTILLLMQRRLYERGGLQAEGIFRINADNSQEEYVREQLNRGVVPDGVDVHCLAGLIKAWFRELPSGLLDSLSSEQVMQSQSEEECFHLVRLLPPTEAALLDWAVNLMADVAQLEQINKMNARNVAMVFAPNMTQMADPLTALMYAVQVMNFLKTLIVRTLKEREDALIDTASASQLDPSDESGHNSSCEPVFDDDMDNSEPEKTFLTEEPTIWSPGHSPLENSSTGKEHHSFLASVDSNISGGNWSHADSCHCEVVSHVANFLNGQQQGSSTALTGVQSNSHMCSGSRKINELLTVQPAAAPVEKGKGTVIISRINSRKELVEAWR